MGKKKVTLSLDSKVYSDFQKYCEDNAIMLSKKIELIMRGFVKEKTKKLACLFILFGIFFISLASAATIFNDDFEDGDLAGWILRANSGANNWTNVTTDPFAGSMHAQSQPQDTLPVPASDMEKIISTVGYENISFSYYRKLVQFDPGDEFQAKWFDGSSWNTVEINNTGGNDASYVFQQFNLTAIANNNPNLRIKLECTAGAVSEFCRIDNLEIIGNIIDITPPQFSNYNESPTNNSNYVQGQFYEFNVTINETNLDGVKINFSGTNYTDVYARGGGIYSFNRTDLAAGTYTYSWWANDTLGNSNSSSERDYVLAKAPGQVSLLLNGNADNLTIQYPATSNISASTNYGSFTIYLNGTNITSQNNQNIIRAAGYYNVTVVSSGDQNHSSSSLTYWLNITKAQSTCSLVIFPGAIITYLTQTNVTASCTNPETSSNLYRNNVLINSENGNNITLGAISYTYKVNVSATQNYSSAENSSSLIVNKATPSATLTSSGGWSVTYGVSTTINVSETNTGDGGVTYDIYRDGIFIGTSETVSLGVGSYNYLLNTTGGQNYSAVSGLDTNTLIVNKANPALNITFTPSDNEDYGTSTTADGTETNGGDPDLVYRLYRNQTLIDSSFPWFDTEILGAGTYLYVFNTTGGTNYTNGSVNATLVINKISNSVFLLLNGNASNLTISFGESVNASASSESGVISISRNGTLVSSENNQDILLNVSYYEYFVNSSGNQNYTENLTGVKLYLNVTPAPDLTGPLINVYRPEAKTYYVNESLELNFTVVDISGVDDCWYDVNGTNISLSACQNTTFSVSGEGNYVLILYANDTLGNLNKKNVSFGVDLTGINLTITQPTGTKTSKTGIPLTYSVAGNNLTCWYNLNFLTGGLVIPNTTITNCAGTNFDVSADGNYVLNLYANNSFGTLNFTNSSFSVSTTSSPPPSGDGGGGGGGGGGIALPKPDLQVGNIEDITVNNVGIKKILIWKVKNIGKTFLNDCVFRSKGELSSWIPRVETKGLAIGEEYEFVFDVNIPQEAETGRHNLEVSVACKEINKTAGFAVEVTNKEIDLVLTNVERDGPENVLVDYTLEDLAGKDQNVTLQFLIFDPDGKQVAEISENKFISAGTKVDFATFIPIDEDLQGQLSLLINLNSDTYSSFVQEGIFLGSPISGLTIFDRLGGTDNFLSILFVILFLGFAFFIVRNIRKHKKKTKEGVHGMMKKNLVVNKAVKHNLDEKHKKK